MIRIAVAGLGKMGASHLSIIRAHPEVELAAVCDSAGYVLDVLEKYTGLKGYTDYAKMLQEVELDAVVVATPSRLHASMTQAALDRGLHVFCEKPFCLDPQDGRRLAEFAAARGLVTQVGYHYRFVGAFSEMKRLIDAGALGEITHVLAEAYGPVVLRRKSSTWRTRPSEGGGCLYDYAAHPINLLNWYFGPVSAVSGSALRKVFSKDAADEAYSMLTFQDGLTAHLSVNWSDESFRKMSTKVTAWGTNGRIVADRQECQVYLRDPALARALAGPPYRAGWNVRYTTELTDAVWFYLRGEEYSAQLAYFVESVKLGRCDNISAFADAVQTDAAIELIASDAEHGRRVHAGDVPQAPRRSKKLSFLGAR
jgi:predicted dehydrogenase